MKTFAAVVAAIVAIAVVAGASFAQAPAPKPAAPAAPAPAAQAPAKAPAVKDITGEFVAMDKTAKTVTVKYVADQKPAQINLSVDEAMLTSLGQFKAGDKVKVTYEEMGGKFIAKSITKA
jgi:cell division protein FtsI/penicillin-binding protein 2